MNVQPGGDCVLYLLYKNLDLKNVIFRLETINNMFDEMSVMPTGRRYSSGKLIVFAFHTIHELDDENRQLQAVQVCRDFFRTVTAKCNAFFHFLTAHKLR